MYSAFLEINNDEDEKGIILELSEIQLKTIFKALGYNNFNLDSYNCFSDQFLKEKLNKKGE